MLSKKRKLICPRRVLEWGPWPHDPTPTDEWRDRSSMVYDGPGTRPSCSHCGSLHPGVLMAGLRAGTLAIGGSDKSYKWYVDRVRTPEQIEEIRASGKYDWLKDSTSFERYVTLDTQIAKFYTAHLSRAQCEEILAMWTAKTLKHSMYVRPWFPALNEDAPDWLVQGTTT